MKTSLVILTLNEVQGLREVFSHIPRDGLCEIFAVDGGSTDGTIEFFHAHNIPTYVQQKRGRGEAFRIAFDKAIGDAIIFFSPDGNENPQDIPKFIYYLEKGFPMVIGTRMVTGAHNEEDEQFFKWRKWANNIFNWMANITWNSGTYISDSINGYRAITKEAWEKLSPDGPGYTIEYQSTIRAMKCGLPIAEFPTFEGVRVGRQDGSPSLQTGISFLKMYFSERKKGLHWKVDKSLN